MKIIGISGFDNAAEFKRRHWPDLEEREYRIVQGQDAAAALIIDGEIVAAAAEERFDRLKHSRRFPIHAIRYCLAAGRLEATDVDEFAHAFDYGRFKALASLGEMSKRRFDEVYSRQTLLARFREHLPEVQDPEARVHGVLHHLAHAASAYHTSGWDECLVVVADGMGEVHSLTVWEGRGGELRCLHRVGAAGSIGILYSVVTLHLGFDFNSDEYKIMGLAPYGDGGRFAGVFRELVQLRDGGALRIPALELRGSALQPENYELTRRVLAEKLIPARHPDDEVTQDHRDVAAALQDRLFETMRHVVSHFTGTTGLRRLAMAGGVALNGTANGKLLASGLVDELHVQPASADDGSALGAALQRAAEHREVRNRVMPVPYLGPASSADEIEAALTRLANRIRVTRFASRDETCAEAAGRIADGQVLAWHRGRMEFGPRALGNRSILADPGHPEMRDRVNAMVKKREAFRPFAPAVSLEQVDRWFDVPARTPLPYMIIIVDVRQEHRASLPAITHVDGSARVQTVAAADNPDFHLLLQAVGRTTGREMVLNTSFNVKGQPIVNTPIEAIETFLGTGIDALFLHDVLVERA